MLFLRKEKFHKDNNKGSDTDADVGDIKRRPMVAREVEIKKVNDDSDRESVVGIRKRAGHNKRESEAKQFFLAFSCDQNTNNTADDECESGKKGFLPAARVCKERECRAAVVGNDKIKEISDFAAVADNHLMLDPILCPLIKSEQKRCKNQPAQKGRPVPAAVDSGIFFHQAKRLVSGVPKRFPMQRQQRVG